MDAIQPIDQKIERRDGYMYVEYSAKVLTLDMIVTLINAVAAGLRDCGLKRVLIVRNAPLLDSDATRSLVASMVRRLVSEDVRFAIVDTYGNDPDAVRRAAASSRQAGWNLNPFDTVEEAE